MANIQLIDSEIAAAFSEIQYLIRFIHAAQNTGDRNLALNQLWNRTAHLKFLIKLLKDTCSSSLTHPVAGTDSGPGALGIGQVQPGAMPQTAGAAGSLAGQSSNSTSQPSNPNGNVFTRDELLQFTGRNGKPAYVAVNGIVYDVTNNAAWSLATHFGLTAGRDLTAEFASCHQGQQWILAQLKPVGRLAE